MTPFTLVLEAVGRRDLASLRQALEQEPGAARAINENGVSALMLAVYGRFDDGIRVLLDNGALNTIHEAAALGDHETIGTLVGRDPDIVHKISPDGAGALHLAAHFGHSAALRVLLRLGADPRRCTTTGFSNTPLHAAAAARRTECAKLLCDAGADPDAPDGNGYTPLHVAAAAGAVDVIRLLLAHQADPEAKAAGKTAHQIAVERDEDEAAALLGERHRRG